jgi:hypothetical protein
MSCILDDAVSAGRQAARIFHLSLVYSHAMHLTDRQIFQFSFCLLCLPVSDRQFLLSSAFGCRFTRGTWNRLLMTGVGLQVIMSSLFLSCGQGRAS